MRFYKVTVDAEVGSDDEPRVAWAATMADARAAKAVLAEKHGQGARSKFVNATETDVPTDKAGLLKFLQENVTE